MKPSVAYSPIRSIKELEIVDHDIGHRTWQTIGHKQSTIKIGVSALCHRDRSRAFGNQHNNINLLPIIAFQSLAR